MIFSSSLLFVSILAYLPVNAIEATLAGVVDWHQPHIGIPLLHDAGAAPSFISATPSTPSTNDSIVTLTQSNVIASLHSYDGSIGQHLRCDCVLYRGGVSRVYEHTLIPEPDFCLNLCFPQLSLDWFLQRGDISFP